MTDAFLSEVVARSYGVSYPAINASELVRLKMPVPSMARQVKVVTELEALEHQTAKQRHYLSLLDSLLSERRQALITATVTGQLDVEAVA
jgi:type I restriction enzyme S subunit